MQAVQAGQPTLQQQQNILMNVNPDLHYRQEA
jgi:hypothetical protein